MKWFIRVYGTFGPCYVENELSAGPLTLAKAFESKEDALAYVKRVGWNDQAFDIVERKRT
jgi:hypothetical protein